MKHWTEIKLAVVGILTVAVILWGINYLRGRNILASTNTFAVTYAAVDGLEPSASILMDGYKIGTVKEVIYDLTQEPPFTVMLEVEKSYPLPQGSVAEIFSADLLGTKAVQITRSGSDKLHVRGDTLKGTITGDMLSGLLDQVEPLLGTVNSAVGEMDSLVKAINALVRGPEISGILGNVDQTSEQLKNQMAAGGDLAQALANLNSFSENLAAQNAAIASAIQNLDTLSSTLADSPLDSLLINLEFTTSNIASITGKLNEGTGTLGKVLNEDSLYQALNSLIVDLDSLIVDLNTNPRKYVQFSLIGR